MNNDDDNNNNDKNDDNDNVYLRLQYGKSFHNLVHMSCVKNT
jgi:hypothetical protein